MAVLLDTQNPPMAAVSSVVPQHNQAVDQSALNESIAKIDALIARGIKVCLFVGRAPKERLPSDKGESKPGEVWVSADKINAGPAFSPDRIHLCFDCNDQETILKLQKRFDMIVVDFSVTRNFHNDFARRFSVMLRSPESPMLFEASTFAGDFTMDPEPSFDKASYWVSKPHSYEVQVAQKTEEFVENYLRTASQKQQQADRAEFMKEGGNFLLAAFCHLTKEESDAQMENGFQSFIAEKAGIDNGDSALMEFGYVQLDAHLKTIYDRVELCRNQPYPYRSDNTDLSSVVYFVVSGPKV